MKDHFSRFALRLVASLLVGLAFLLLHGRCGVVGRIFAPGCPSAWELSKLAFWPMLLVLLLTSGLSGGVKATLLSAAPHLVLAPAGLCLALWAVSGMSAAGGVSLVIWVVATVVGLAMANQSRVFRGSGAWLVALAALGVAYIVFSFLPPMAGPFLDPTDAAAMATIPY